MSRVRTVTATIVDWETLNNGVEGQPRFSITFDDGETRISQTAAAWTWGFGTNKGLCTDDRVTMTLSRAGTIVTMVPAAKCDDTGHNYDGIPGRCLDYGNPS